MLYDISREELKIRIHHVGGIGGYGPAEILSRLGHVQWIIYDAETKSLKSSNKVRGGFILVNKCIGKKNYLGKFNRMYASSASSMFEGSRSASEYSVINSNGTAQIWGIHTKVTKTYRTKVYSLDWLINIQRVPPIDFLSMDVQGAELDILNGASDSLKSSIIGVVCETEFSPLYEDQPLFSDIQNRLRRDKYRLLKIYNLQNFNSSSYVKELTGSGFLVVGESLFLKDKSFRPNLSKEEIIQFIKLAACAVVFDQLDYALKIIDILVRKKLISLETLSKKTNVSYVKMLKDLYFAKIEIDKKIPPLVYESTNTNDMAEKGYVKDSNIFIEEVINIAEKLKLLFIFLSLSVFRRILSIIGQEWDFYLSYISRIYSKYSLGDLAKMHDRRLFEFRLFLKPSHIDGFLRLILKQQMNHQLTLAVRNYFKGKYS